VGAALGTHWIVNASWSEALDTPVSQATFVLIQQIGTASLSPLMAASPLNVDDAAAYAPLLDVGRLVRASTATMAHGVALDVTKYREIFTGRIDSVEQADAPGAVMAITIPCSDLGGWLMDTQIEVDARQYGSEAGVPLGTAIQQIVTDNPDGSGISVTLYDQSTNAFNVTSLAVGRLKVLEAIRNAALDTTGDDVRYRYDAAHASRLTRFNPDRARVTVDATFSPNRYVLRSLDLSLANIRNAGKLPYTDASGAPQAVTAADAASILKYRRRYFELASSPLITTSGEATTLLAAVVNDLSGAPAEASAEIPYCWFVQIYDRYTFAANNRQYDSDQAFAVLGYQHTIENGRGTTTLTLTARIVGAYSEWRKRISTVPSVTPAILDFRFTETETTRTYTGMVVQGVDRVWVYEHLVTAGADDLFPSDGELPTAVLVPVAGVVTHTVTKPPQGKQLRAPVRATDRHRGLGRRPPEHRGGGPLRPGRPVAAVVTNDTAALTLTVAGAASNWPVQVDLYEDAVALYSTAVGAPSTLSGSTLAGRVLPQRELRRWAMRLTDVAGLTVWAFASADRDALPSGTVTPSDYKLAPSLACAYDDDTDTIRVTTPSGKTKTFSGLSGGGVATYTVGDALDDATFESTMSRGETRGVYLVEYQGGGQYLTVFTGPLHGLTAAGPSLDAVQTRGPTSDSIAYTAASGTVELSINGGAYSTAPASPIVVTRPSAGASSLTYTLRLTVNGQTVTDSFVILAVDQDTNTVTPDLAVSAGVTTNTTVPFTVTATNPSGGAAPTITVELVGCSATVGGVAKAAGTTTTVASGTLVTADRPTFGGSNTANQPTVLFRATLSGGGGETIARTVLPQVKEQFGPSLSVTPTPGSSSFSLAYVVTGTLTLSIDGGSYSAAAASPIVVSRDASDHTYSFKAIADGQTLVQNITVPALAGTTSAPTLTGLSAFNAFFPGTGAGSVDIGWTNNNIPTGTTFDLTYKITVGNTSGSDNGTVTMGTNPYTLSHPLGPTAPEGQIVVIAKLNGVAIATAAISGAFAF
jgi:hypothetical protein